MSALVRIRDRFEVAVGNFARSSFDLQANEKAFQAWYAASVIHEFGMSRVYREVHLNKRELKELVDPDTWSGVLDGGNEVLPDLCVSWEPAIDARHTAARPASLDAGGMLRQLAIVSEFKVTGSTKSHTPPRHIRQDLMKLGLLTDAHLSAGSASARKLSCYLVILDNHGAPESPKGHYGQRRMNPLLSKTWESWPERVPRPTVLVATHDGRQIVVDRYPGD